MDLKKGKSYQAEIKLSGLDVIATNNMIATEFTKLGFANVIVEGKGNTRTAKGTWSKEDIVNAPLDKRVNNVREV